MNMVPILLKDKYYDIPISQHRGCPAQVHHHRHNAAVAWGQRG
ncbi:MAG TPA: hypothetical protein P5526_06210 [Anaerolineae bacterium]|nr:hypothetical protein [Anaerolineae bacterium]